jgi:predicted DNA binding CopG/RHH family protein
VPDQPPSKNVNNMSQKPEFPFDRARRVTPEENQKFRAAISEQFGLELKKRGRPSKEEEEKYEPISIRLHPKILVWAKKEAEKQGIGYQTLINELLLAQISQS